MILRDSKGEEFELSIGGYEFPHSHENWLLMDVRMKGPRASEGSAIRV